jgi:hypothetical protein
MRPTRPPWLRPATLGLVASLTAAACLPEDDIPAPGVAQFSFVGDPSQGTLPESADGWTLVAKRALVGLQLSYQQLDSCDVYSQSGLEPILANALVSESAYLGRVRGLGQCTSPVILDSFVYISRFGAGTSHADVDTINAVLDRSELTRDSHNVSLYLDATLQKGTQQKHLEWALVLPYVLLACPPRGGGVPTLGYQLDSGKSENFTMSFRLEQLFWDGLGESAASRLAPYADADRDGDGEITLDEVAATPLTDYAEATGGYQELLPGNASSPTLGTVNPTLLDWLAARLPRSFFRAEAANACALGGTSAFGGAHPGQPGSLGPLPSE